MNNTQICCLSILAYAVLMLIGGIIGFKKAKSKASLIAGVISAIALSICSWFSQSNPASAFKLAFILIGALDGVFLVRLIKTKKFMPSGLMLILSILEQVEIYHTMVG